MTELDKAYAENAALPTRCDDCGLGYGVDESGQPLTALPNTCDDCGGYVDDVDVSKR